MASSISWRGRALGLALVWLWSCGAANAVAPRSIDFATGGARAELTATLQPASRALSDVEVRLTVPRLEVDDDRNGFQPIRVEGLVPWGRPGDPSLAGAGALIAVPDGFEPELSITRIEERVIPGLLVPPRQRATRCEGGGEPGFAFNARLYETGGTYPPAPAELQEVGRLQGLRLVRVALYPLRQSFATRALSVATELTVRVRFRRTRAAVAIARLSPALWALARSATVNGKALGAWVRPSPGPETFLVFTADRLKSTLAPLLAWKRAKGFHVEVFTFTEAGGTADRIKAYLQDYYDTHSPKPGYVLFVGNRDTLPTFFRHTENGAAASDYPYSLLSGKDPVPDVLYGRLVADAPEEAQLQIARWIAYERSPVTGDWYPQATTIASSTKIGDGPSDVEYAQQVQSALKAGTYRLVDPFYQTDGTATAARISEALGAGRTWLTYIGHGVGNAWVSTNDLFDSGTVDALPNVDKLPVLVDVACLNGAWAAPYRCFGRHWITHTWQGRPAGAVAYYGGSVQISIDPPAVMAVGIAKSHFQKGLSSLGSTLLGGQLYLLEQMGVSAQTVDNLTWYNLLGDPSLLMWTSTPRAYKLTTRVSAEGSGTEIAVHAADAGGRGIVNLEIAVGKEAEEPLSVAVSDDNGDARLRLAGPLPAGARLTATGYDDAPVQVAIP